MGRNFLVYSSHSHFQPHLTVDVMVLWVEDSERREMKGEKKNRNNPFALPGCVPEFIGHLGVQILTVDHLPLPLFLRWPRFLHHSVHFTHHSHHHSKNQWQLFPNLFPAIHPLLGWRVLRRQESEPRRFQGPRTATQCLARQVTQPEAQVVSQARYFP